MEITNYTPNNSQKFDYNPSFSLFLSAMKLFAKSFIKQSFKNSVQCVQKTKLKSNNTF